MDSDKTLLRKENIRIIEEFRAAIDQMGKLKEELAEEKAARAREAAQSALWKKKYEDAVAKNYETRSLQGQAQSGGLPADHRAPADITDELADADARHDRRDKERGALIGRLEDGSMQDGDGRMAAGILREDEVLISEHMAGAAAIAASNARLRGELRKYDNENTPSSRRHPWYKKTGKKDDKKPAKKSGRKPGHPGVSRKNKADRTEHHRPERCVCGSRNLKDIGSSGKMITDIPYIPACEFVYHVSHKCKCLDCGVENEGKTPGISHTSLGSNLMTMAAGMWHAHASIRSICEFVYNQTGLKISAGAMQNALESLGEKAEVVKQDLIKELVAGGSCNADETGYPLNGDDGWAWVYVTLYITIIDMAGSRSSLVPLKYLPLDMMIVCDGYSVYIRFRVKQRCWAHILRTADSFADEGPAESELCGMLHDLYRDVDAAWKAKLGEAAARRRMAELDARLSGIVAAYEGVQCTFAGTLGKAEPDLFNCILYHVLTPTNNDAERAVRYVVAHRRCRQQLRSEGGMKMFGALLTCILTWKKRGISVREGVLSLMGG
ncbi:transposase [Cenarchaeum symbiosum A]|uniref:Transposase n=1 Tax=Cenarchaeum symbiosum (strain A) TaxID=414004 RepID=A0RVC8_CENSY|nr:transposase [Cenarchaeum symbiosum A]